MAQRRAQIHSIFHTLKRASSLAAVSMPFFSKNCSLSCFFLVVLLVGISDQSALNAATVEPQADAVYRNGAIFTSNLRQRHAEALAIRHGRILYIGSDRGVGTFIGPKTSVKDLKGRFLMSGLVDGHMHPLDGGRFLLKPNLNYESLTEPEFRNRIQKLLDESSNQEPDGWLDVANWFQENMRPAGIRLTRESLDQLKTRRPIVVRSSFGHTVLANSRALALAHITASSPDPADGKIWRDSKGEPTGLLEDSAFEVFNTLVPPATSESDVKAAQAALESMSKQGVTSFLDAAASVESVAAFSTVHASGKLTARAHFAPVITPKEGEDPKAAVTKIKTIARQYDGGALNPTPGISVRHAKMFIDGVISVPACTGSLLEPYRANVGTSEKPIWITGTNRGSAVYFPPNALASILIGLGEARIDPHLHVDGDGAVRAGLDACQVLRKTLPGVDVRPSLAHNELVDPSDFHRFRDLGVTPVLSFQWARPTGDQVALLQHLGPRRSRFLEPSGRFVSTGVQPAFGSDWPVDVFNEWLAFQIGLTRKNLSDDKVNLDHRPLPGGPVLSVEKVLLAATIQSARELHMDDVTGSLEVGKFADFIILDRNPFKIPAETVSKVKVLQTVVGGALVFGEEFKN